jgi:hypothetical protein
MSAVSRNELASLTAGSFEERQARVSSAVEAASKKLFRTKNTSVVATCDNYCVVEAQAVEGVKVYRVEYEIVKGRVVLKGSEPVVLSRVEPKTYVAECCGAIVDALWSGDLDGAAEASLQALVLLEADSDIPEPEDFATRFERYLSYQLPWKQSFPRLEADHVDQLDVSGVHEIKEEIAQVKEQLLTIKAVLIERLQLPDLWESRSMAVDYVVDVEQVIEFLSEAVDKVFDEGSLKRVLLAVGRVLDHYVASGRNLLSP